MLVKYTVFEFLSAKGSFSSIDLFPLTRPTLKKGPYPKDFISIFSQEIFFLNSLAICKLRELSNINSVIFKKILCCKLFVYLMLLPKVGLFTIKFNGFRNWEVK